MAVEPLTLRELLKDPIYKAWFMRLPKLTKDAGRTSPWRVFLLTHEGKWKKAEFWTYAEAYRFVAKNLKKYQDLVISSKRQCFKPPVIRWRGKKVYWPSPPGHSWCGFCRRPTVFALFRRHHAMPVYNNQEERCSVCGVRKAFLPRYRSSVSWEQVHG